MNVDVVVIISTCNGSKNIIRQLDSIFAQKNLEISVFIRDDYSTDNTIEVIEKYKKKTSNKIVIIRGENEGYAKSFWDALCLAPEASYYAFSDQDDVWDEEKLFKCICSFTEEKNVPQLSYCRMTRTNSDLIPLKEQVNVLKPEQLSKKLVLTQTFNYGAATVINASARALVCRHFPRSELVPHDAWVGMLCFWFGKVHFVDESLYYWIRYYNSVTGAGTKLSGIKFRFKETIKGKAYMNVSDDLLNNYMDLLNDEDYDFLCKVRDYKSIWYNKLSLIFDKSLKRKTLMGSIMLKFEILTNHF